MDDVLLNYCCNRYSEQAMLCSRWHRGRAVSHAGLVLE
jgi:hypothetical protein